MKKNTTHANFEISKNVKNYANFSSNSNDLDDFTKHLSVSWSKIFKNFDPVLIVNFQKQFIQEYSIYLVNKFSISITFSTRFAANLFEFQKLFDDFKLNLPKSDSCKICSKFYNGLKTHFFCCFNNEFKKFVGNFDLWSKLF